MSGASSGPLKTWLALFGALRRYHRYEVRGMEHALTPRASLLVGYHGRPLALDLCMFTVTFYEQMGYLPHGVIHGHFDENPALRRAIDGIGLVTGDGPEMGAAVARGEHILVEPGGTREGCRSFRHRYRVDWGSRVGYLKLAIKYGLPIIPIGGTGMDDMFIGLNDGYAWGKRLGAPARLPVWIGVGATGLWPLSLPWPVKIIQWVGAPIETHLTNRVSPEDRVGLLAIHEEVTGVVQALIDGARGKISVGKVTVGNLRGGVR